MVCIKSSMKIFRVSSKLSVKCRRWGCKLISRRGMILSVAGLGSKNTQICKNLYKTAINSVVSKISQKS